MRAQQSFELLTVISIIMILTLLVVAFVSQQAGKTQEHTNTELMARIADNMQQELGNIKAAPTSIIRNFSISAFSGNISLEDGYHLIFDGPNQGYIHFLDSYLHGEPCIGRNTLFKTDHLLSICCECNEQPITFENETVYFDTPFRWKTANWQEGIMVDSLAQNCTSTTTHAHFNISATPLININTTKHVDHWFYIREPFEIPSSIDVTITCYENDTAAYIMSYSS